MKVEHLYCVKVSFEELRDMIANEIEMQSDEIVKGTPECKRLRAMAKKARAEHSYVEVEGDGVVLMIDGVAHTEDLE